MNMRLMFAAIAVTAFAPMLAMHTGLRPSLSVGSGYTSDWQAEAPGDAAEHGPGYQCIATGADLRRATGAVINGVSAGPSWVHPVRGLTPVGQFVCVSS